MQAQSREFLDADGDESLGLDVMEMLADMTLGSVLVFQQSQLPMPADEIVAGLLQQLYGLEA
jgi:hypothetical protein